MPEKLQLTKEGRLAFDNLHTLCLAADFTELFFGTAASGNRFNERNQFFVFQIFWFKVINLVETWLNTLGLFVW